MSTGYPILQLAAHNLPVTADALAQLLTVPPYAAAAVALTGSSYFSDRMQSRGLYMAVASMVGSIGYMYAPFGTCKASFGLISLPFVIQSPADCPR